MPRPTWKGHLKLSLVTCPVALYPATTSRERISFHIMNRKTGARTKYLVVDSQTDEPVEAEDRVRGYQIGKNNYVFIEDEEIESVKIDSTHTIDIDSFVARKEVDEIYLDSPYYLAPDGKVGEDAFLVIREAMRETEMVGIARVVISRRERMVLIEPRGKGFLATTLRSANEVRKEAPYFEDISDRELPEEMLSIAKDIIARKAAKFDPSKFVDRYEQALRELVEAKRTGQPVHVEEAPQPRTAPNLLEALRRSLEREPAAPSARTRGRRRTADRAPAPAGRRKANGKAAARRAS
ncbi:MAG: Ku protein [Proteobacteria bacterium]|jgi:DNA end-binding protein Ku|nr:MAG: Ku protein [Pseudomonadota bacterium]